MSTFTPVNDPSQRELTILLVEDNYLVANMLNRMLDTLGCQVVGPAPSIDRAMDLARDHQLSGAILDINIIGGTSAPIAQFLKERDTPFVFITGYASPQGLPDDLAHIPKLTKPIDPNALEKVIRKQFGV
ncbi:MAG: response regulator [Planctomycetes bacterium]|nr:response regulator [Planctomycetota bacterium]